MRAFQELVSKRKQSTCASRRKGPQVFLTPSEDESDEDSLRAREVKNLQEIMAKAKKKHFSKSKVPTDKESASYWKTSNNSSKFPTAKEQLLFNLPSKQSQSDSDQEIITRKPRKRLCQEETEENSPVFDLVIGSQQEPATD